MIRLDNVVKRFGRVTAVDGLSLEVPAGEFFVFLGPNGAGKTTTIKLIAGLLRPTSGRVLLGGFDVQADSIRARSIISYVPDQPFLYEKLTGREFMWFVGRMYGMEDGTIRREVDRMADVFELHDFLDEMGQTYSHGMKQRVVVGAALLHDPKVLVIDEPLVGLDPKGANTLKNLLRDLTAGGVAVFMSTHTLAVAEETADRVGIIRRGSLIALGTLEEIYAAAQTDSRLEDAFLRLTEES
ncbi:MAG: ABC transporter ATP-binding protein [Candidatus Brocadiaceae bacterium]|nr:ABC transporter ATP-binding protein [Candidatus Brocadiaceae bacterium]